MQIEREHLETCPAGRSYTQRGSQQLLSNENVLTTVASSPKVISLQGILLTWRESYITFVSKMIRTDPMLIIKYKLL